MMKSVHQSPSLELPPSHHARYTQLSVPQHVSGRNIVDRPALQLIDFDKIKGGPDIFLGCTAAELG